MAEAAKRHEETVQELFVCNQRGLVGIIPSDETIFAKSSSIRLSKVINIGLSLALACCAKCVITLHTHASTSFPFPFALTSGWLCSPGAVVEGPDSSAGAETEFDDLCANGPCMTQFRLPELLRMSDSLLARFELEAVFVVDPTPPGHIRLRAASSL